MDSRPKTLMPLVPREWKLRFTVVCIQLLLMVGATSASWKFAQQSSLQRRLRAYTDTSQRPQHAPPVKSFLVSDGSWVDCVPIEGQIAAHHPSLKDRIIQMRPSSPCRSSRQSRASDQLHPQLFAREYGHCPEGSIPVQRTDSNHPYLKKSQAPRFQRFEPSAPASSTNQVGTEATHEYATTGLLEIPRSYTGASAIFSVNGPVIQDTSRDFSLSQLWIVDGYWDDYSLTTIEVGWQTYPIKHGSNAPLAPHLFIYWTRDAYEATGCYNVKNCSGFVQVDHTWVIGDAMPAFATGTQNPPPEVEIEVLYDSPQGLWWLWLNRDAVGYWPKSIFGSKLQGSARRVRWGGEVVFVKDATTSTHSKTEMGSGAFPSAFYPAAAYQRNLSYADASGNFFYHFPSVLKSTVTVDDPRCYNISVQLRDATNWGTYFFYGGSGGNNPGCVGKP